LILNSVSYLYIEMNRFRLLRDTYTNTSNIYGMFTNSSLYNDLDIHLSPPLTPQSSQSLFPPLTPRIHANDSNVLEQIFQKQNEFRIYGNDNIYGSWLKELVQPKQLDKKHRIEFNPTMSRLNVMNK